MKKLPFVLISILFGSFFIYQLFHAEEANLILKGAVWNDVNPVGSVNIYVEKPYEKNNDGPLYYEPSSIRGSFSLQFNAIEHERIYLIFRKKNFSKLRMSFTPDFSKFEQTNQKQYRYTLDNTYLFDFGKEGLKPEVFRGSFSKDEMIVFGKDVPKANPDTFLLDRIDYFSLIEKGSAVDTIFSTKNAKVPFKGDWYKVHFKLNGREYGEKGWVLYENVSPIVKP